MQQLVYCMATIEEIQRLSCVAPGSLPHVLTKNMSIHGYDFPEGSIFMANMTKFLKDPLVYSEPARFIPERFLDTDGAGKLNIKVIMFQETFVVALVPSYCFIKKRTNIELNIC